MDGVRNFRPKQTIFEIGSTSKSTAQSVMMSKRKRHSEVIEKAQRLKHDDSATLQGRGGSTKREEQDSVLTTDEIKGFFVTVFDPSEKKKRKRKSDREDHSTKTFRDENYIPHTASDYYGEKGLGLGLNSFEKDVSGAVMDIEADEDEGMRRTKANKKWDRKRKNYVGEDGNTKKIRTESGVRIPATYKKNIYQDWLRRNKMDVPGSEDREENGTRPGHKRGKKGKGTKKFPQKVKGFGGKRADSRGSELKFKEQILKARHRKERIMQRQNKGGSKGKGNKGRVGRKK